MPSSVCTTTKNFEAIQRTWISSISSVAVVFDCVKCFIRYSTSKFRCCFAIAVGSPRKLEREPAGYISKGFSRLSNFSRCLQSIDPFIKSLLIDNGKEYRVVCKPLARGQSFTLMCGYITKDEGRPWYQCRIPNIPREDLQQGRLQHISAQTAIDDGKVF